MVLTCNSYILHAGNRYILQGVHVQYMTLTHGWSVQRVNVLTDLTLASEQYCSLQASLHLRWLDIAGQRALIRLRTTKAYAISEMLLSLVSCGGHSDSH